MSGGGGVGAFASVCSGADGTGSFEDSIAGSIAGSLAESVAISLEVDDSTSSTSSTSSTRELVDGCETNHTPAMTSNSTAHQKARITVGFRCWHA